MPGSGGASSPDLAVDERGTAHIVWGEGGEVGSEGARYCQLPRGSRSCVHSQTLTVPAAAGQTDLDGPRVLLGGKGQVIVLEEFDFHLYAFVSSDGGAGFAAPVEISYDTPGVYSNPQLGPGSFSVATIGDARFQAAPLSGQPPASDRAELGGSSFTGGGNGAIAFVDPYTPIAAYRDPDSGHVLLRRFAGGTEYNDAAAWGPPTDLGPGEYPLLAGLESGRRGIHLLVLRGGAGKGRYFALTYDGATFGHPTAVSKAGVPAYPASFFMDAGAHLHAVWLDKDSDLVQRVSLDGATWRPIEVLARTAEEPGSGSLYTVRAATAADGGGYAFYETGGPLRVVPIPPNGSGAGKKGGSGACVDSLRVGGATVLAQEGCLRGLGGGRYASSGKLRVNGIDLSPRGGRFVADVGDRTLISSAKVEAKMGDVELAVERIGWRLPAGKGQIHDLAGNPAGLQTEKLHQKALGLPISGYAVPSLEGPEKVAVPVRLGLPAPFETFAGESVTGGATLRASNNASLDLAGLRVHVGGLWLGIAEVEGFDLSFVDFPAVLRGSSAIVLPVAGSKLEAEFGLRQGSFDYGRGALEFTSPTELPVAADVLLKRISFAVQGGGSCAKPTRIGGGVRFVSGPEVAGASLIAVDGDVGYAFPPSDCGKPGVLEVTGAGSLVTVPVSKLTARLTTEGQFTFATGFGFGVPGAGVDVSVDGGIDIPSRTFFADGHATISVLFFHTGGEAIVSSVGIAACMDVGFFAEAGFHYRWGDGFGLEFPSCDLNLSSYKPIAFQSSAHASAAAAGFELPAGLPAASVRIDGDGGAPGVIVRGPGGFEAAFPDPASFLDEHGFAAASHGTQTFVRIDRPRAGAYTVSGAGGAPVTGVAVAHELPAPRVRGRVSRPAARRGVRILTYRARAIGGQRLLFVEEGAHGVRDVLGGSASEHGRLRFRPTGPRGKRTIYAIVLREGLPRTKIQVARYRAPGPTLPGRPRGLRLRRRGSRLVVSWGGVPGARRYGVAWKLRDGRRAASTTRRHRFAIRGVPGIDAGRVTVAGLRADGVAGRLARARLKARPKRLHHHRRGGRHGRRHRRRGGSP